MISQLFPHFTRLGGSAAHSRVHGLTCNIGWCILSIMGRGRFLQVTVLRVGVNSLWMQIWKWRSVKVGVSVRMWWGVEGGPGQCKLRRRDEVAWVCRQRWCRGPKVCLVSVGRLHGRFVHFRVDRRRASTSDHSQGGVVVSVPVSHGPHSTSTAGILQDKTRRMIV